MKLENIVKGTLAAGLLATSVAHAKDTMHLVSTQDDTPYSVTMCDSISDYRNGACRSASGVLDRGESASVDLRNDEGKSPVYFERSSNLLSNLPLNNDQIFKDNFETGVGHLEITTGSESYTLGRDGDLFVADLECNTDYFVEFVTTPTPSPWDFSYDPLLSTMNPEPAGFSYSRPCGDDPESTVVTATNDGESDVFGILFNGSPQITTLEGIVGASGNFDASEGVISVPLNCDEPFSGQLLVNHEGSYEFAYDNVPSGVAADDLGFIEYTPACSGPSSVGFSAQASNDAFTTPIVDVEFTINNGASFDIEGLDFENDGSVSSTPYHGTWADANNDGVIDQPVKVRAGRSAVNAWEAYVLASDGKSVTLDPESTLPSYITTSGNMIEYLPDDEHIGEAGSLEFLVCDEADTSDCRSLSVPYEVMPREPEIVGLSYTEQNGTIDNPNTEGIFNEWNTVDCQLSEVDERYVVATPYDFEYNFDIDTNGTPNMGINGGTGRISFNANCGQAGQEYFPQVKVTGSGGESTWVTAGYKVE